MYLDPLTVNYVVGERSPTGEECCACRSDRSLTEIGYARAGTVRIKVRIAEHSAANSLLFDIHVIKDITTANSGHELTMKMWR